jgi:hypothetical protein
MGIREATLEDFGGGPGDTDNTPALDAVGEQAREEGAIVLRLGVGVYRFASKPSDFTSCVKIVGVDKFRSRLMRCYSAASGREGFLTWREAADAVVDPTGQTIRASELRDCQVICDDGTESGTLVVMTTDGPVTGWLRIARVKISHNNLGGSYARCLLLDGRKNVKVGGQGLRDCFLEDVFLFAPRDSLLCASFLNCTNLVGSFWAGGDVVVSGAGPGVSASTYGRLFPEVLGTLTYDWAVRYSSFGNAGQVVKTENAIQCVHKGNG